MTRGRFSCQRLGQAPISTGVPAADKLMQHPLAKVLAIGGLAAAAAKTFPGQFFAPFVGSSVAALMFGLVPEADFSVTGKPKEPQVAQGPSEPQPQTLPAPTQPASPESPGAPTRVA